MSEHRTRIVTLWLSNDEASYKEAQAYAAERIKHACDNESHAPTAKRDAAEALAEDLETMLCHSMPCRSGVWGDLISSLISDIDFEEVATEFLEDYPVYSIFTSDAEDAELFTGLDEARDHLMGLILDVPGSEGLTRLVMALEPGGSVEIGSTTYVLTETA
jgi:hypothetical protein